MRLPLILETEFAWSTCIMPSIFIPFFNAINEDDDMSKKCKWLPILYSTGKRQHSISFVYRSYHLPMPDPSPSTLTV